MNTRDRINEYLDKDLSEEELSETERKDLKKYVTALALIRERTNYRPSKKLKSDVLGKLKRANLLPYRLGILTAVCVLAFFVAFDFFSANVIEIRSRNAVPDPFEQLLMLQRSTGPLVYSLSTDGPELAGEPGRTISIEDALMRSMEFLRDDVKAGADLAVVSSTY